MRQSGRASFIGPRGFLRVVDRTAAEAGRSLSSIVLRYDLERDAPLRGPSIAYAAVEVREEDGHVLHTFGAGAYATALNSQNETTVNDYVDRIRETGSEEVVLCSQGQANWAVVKLLTLLAEAAPAVPILHWGDLDRSGVLILRSLRRRTALPIEPLWMDVPTYRRFVGAGLPLPPEEKKQIDSLLRAHGDGTGGELLSAIRKGGKWIEQETVADGVLMGAENGEQPEPARSGPRHGNLAPAEGDA